MLSSVGGKQLGNEHLGHLLLPGTLGTTSFATFATFATCYSCFLLLSTGRITSFPSICSFNANLYFLLRCNCWLPQASLKCSLYNKVHCSAQAGATLRLLEGSAEGKGGDRCRLASVLVQRDFCSCQRIPKIPKSHESKKSSAAGWQVFWSNAPSAPANESQKSPKVMNPKKVPLQAGKCFGPTRLLLLPTNPRNPQKL